MNKPLTYTAMDVLLASAEEPIGKAQREYQLTMMWQALADIEHGPNPTRDNWRACSDAVNLLGTLVAMEVLADENGLLADATNALIAAGQRSLDGGAIRLDGPGIQAVRSVLEDYAAALEVLPARTILKAHRQTERTLNELRKASAANRAPGVKVMAL